MAKTLNLDRSERVDITCKKGDTFQLNLQISDEDGAPVGLTNKIFILEIRQQDNFDEVNAYDQSTNPEGFTLKTTGTNSAEETGLVSFSFSASQMEIESGLYVYDIQQNTTDGGDPPQVVAVETLIYGIVKVNEDITV